LYCSLSLCLFFFSSRRRHTRFSRDWSSDVCSSDLRMRALRLAPYLGVHTGLGTYRKGASDFPSLHDNLAELGYQFGVRFQPWVYLGLDAQVRWMSDAAYRDQGEAFERTQVLLGITIL